MAFRYKSVRERCIEALIAKLETIRESNGYNYTVRHISRKRSLPDRANDPPEFFVFTTGSEHIVHNTTQYRDLVNLEIWFIVDNTSSDEEDTIYNMLVADIQKALTCYYNNEIVDTSHPEGRIVDVITTGDKPLYSNVREAQIIGKVMIELQHTRIIDDPNRWDVEDEAVVKEE